MFSSVIEEAVPFFESLLSQFNRPDELSEYQVTEVEIIQYAA